MKSNAKKSRILDEIYDYALDNLDLFLKDFEEREPELYRQFERNAELNFQKDLTKYEKYVQGWRKTAEEKVKSLEIELKAARLELKNLPIGWIPADVYEKNRKNLEKYWK